MNYDIFTQSFLIASQSQSNIHAPDRIAKSAKITQEHLHKTDLYSRFRLIVKYLKSTRDPWSKLFSARPNLRPIYSINSRRQRRHLRHGKADLINNLTFGEH
jgi:hypothetical protein